MRWTLQRVAWAALLAGASAPAYAQSTSSQSQGGTAPDKTVPGQPPIQADTPPGYTPPAGIPRPPPGTPPAASAVSASPVEPQPPSKRRKSGVHEVKVHKDEKGYTLRVDGRDTHVFGMNWAYMPIGQNYSYDFWGKPDDFIKEALADEMTLLADMGINVIRLYNGVPKRWIEYIYDTYGIFTVLNHPVGRYGFSMDGTWIFPTNYQDPAQRAYLKKEIFELVEEFKDTRGLMFWLLGNENNYGLFWTSTEIEDLPTDVQGDARAEFLYSLFGETIDGIHEIDDKHPVAIANGDLQFIDQIAKYAPNLDILGSNVYRGKSSGDLFERVGNELGVPFVYTEFGSDAYNAKDKREDQLNQAIYLHSQWEEIYLEAYGQGRSGTAIGGMIFQWSDGWWKYRQTQNLDVHDKTASWATGAYEFDFVEGQNNMNEEWFGIVAKGPNDGKGIYEVYPRAAYYMLKEAFTLDPYAAATTPQLIQRHFDNIEPKAFTTQYDVHISKQRINLLEMARLKNLIFEHYMFTTGGHKLNVPARDQKRFDHMQSMYAEFEVKPSDDVRATATINVLGNVAVNPIDEIYFENRGVNVEVVDSDREEVILRGLQRIKLYQATLEWKSKYFDLEGFYRSGHGHWGYEGDFFGIYPEAYYQPSIDAFNADAPNGFVITGKRMFEGLKIAAGPELWWGANPTIIAKYYRKSGPWSFSFVHQEDIAQRADALTSSVLPVPQTRKSAAYLAYEIGKFKLEFGGLLAGTDRLDRLYQGVRDADGQPGYLGTDFFVLEDRIELLDTLGAKVKLTYTGGLFNFYMQGGYRGLVADSGVNPTPTFTGWGLTEAGQGNHYGGLAGMLLNLGNFSVGPNFLYQKPLEGPLPLIEDFFDPNTGRFFPGVNARNQFDDPFWVRANRETIGFEMLIAYDPTPATWMFNWDALQREDAPFAGMIDFTYRILPTSQDAAVAIAAEGFPFAFANAAPAQNLWDVRGRLFFNPTPKLKIISDVYGGITQSTGSDDRLIKRFGVYGRALYENFSLEAWLKVNDWGPFDYYRDFNLTFPLQTIADFSYSLGLPQWWVQAYTRFGIRTKLRFLDENSGRFDPTVGNPDRLGNEWEVLSYVIVSL